MDDQSFAAPRTDADSSIEFLKAIRRNGPWVLTAVIPDGMTTTMTFNATDVEAVRDFIETCNVKQNIYYTGNPCGRPTKKPAKVDMTGAVFLHTDDDPRAGETPEAAKVRITAAYDDYDPPPSIVVDSGNGLQALWLLDEEYRFDAEINKDIAEIETRNRALAAALGTQPGTHNVDRLLRLPGTINHPNAAKRHKGRTACQSRIVRITDARYPLARFPKTVEADDVHIKDKIDIDVDGIEDINVNDPRLAKLGAKWKALGVDGTGIAEDYGGDRSRAVLAFACECLRAGVDEDAIASCLLYWKIGDHVRDQPNFRRSLRRTIEKAHTFVEDSKLYEMNEVHCVLPIGGKTKVATWGSDPDFPGRQTIIRSSMFNDFKSLHDKYRHSFEAKDKKGNPKTETMGLGSWWISQPHRRQYDGGMRFMPERDEDVVNGDILNLWQGFAVQARKPEGKSGEAGCKLFLDHGLNIICSGNEAHYDYLIKREAFIAQRRTRSEVAVGLKTEIEGTGKGVWCRIINYLFGIHAMEVQNPEHVTGKHNPHLEKLLKLTADEALFALNPHHRNALYNLITEPRITIEPKFVDAYPAMNHLNIDVISNADHFLPVSRSARRLFVPSGWVGGPGRGLASRAIHAGKPPCRTRTRSWPLLRRHQASLAAAKMTLSSYGDDEVVARRLRAAAWPARRRAGGASCPATGSSGSEMSSSQSR